MEIG
ncbi:hypothetical protein D047_4979A, partial [Vibrio parahaemolyticus VPTS-2010_2]|jgi:hypothetical protein